jgi:hypothetical protein
MMPPLHIDGDPSETPEELKIKSYLIVPAYSTLRESELFL